MVALLCTAVIVLSLLNLLGWQLTPEPEGGYKHDDPNNHPLTRLFLPGGYFNSMVMATSLSFLVLSVALFLQVCGMPFRGRRPLVLTLAWIAVFWSVGEMLEPVLSGSVRQAVLVREACDILANSQMSMHTARLFLLIGCALVGIGLRPGRLQKYVAVASSVAAIVYSCGMLSTYLLGFQHTEQGAAIAMALPTALNFLLQTIALLASTGPRTVFVRIFAAKNISGMLLRAFLPGTVVIFILSHGLWVQFDVRSYSEGGSERLGFLAFAWLLATVLTIGVLIVLVSLRVGHALEKAQEELTKARNRAEMAAISRDLFLAQVSHELRTPLNHILGFCQLLEFSPLDERQQRDLGKINSAGHNLLALIEDILDYQKIIMGQIPMHIEDVEAAPLIKEITDAMEPKVRERGNSFHVHIAPNLGKVRADARRFRQILTNLLSNASKFTTKGAVTVSARGKRLNDRHWLEVKVSDTGKGIPPDDLKKLFVPFGRLHDRKENPEGTGLGLVISKTLCEKMEGSIEASSRLGRGSTFTFYLPLSQPPAQDEILHRTVRKTALHTLPRLEPDTTFPEPIETHIAPANYSVLVVDDDPQVGELMKRFLGKEGYTVTVANSGKEALQLVQSIHPDIITLDLVMPGMDGWSVLSALKQDPKTFHIPVIIASMLDDKPRGYQLGAAEFISKPVEWDHLVSLLHKYRAKSNTILLVDDDASFREICRRSLEKTGWKVLEAGNGRAGLDCLEETIPNLVLLDLMMPIMNGFEFLAEMHAHPRWSKIPVIIVTAKDLSDEDRDRLNVGVLDIIAKGQRNLDVVLKEILADVHKLVPAR